jgi:flagellar biosynthesis anti-sigma factor FlgM
MINVNDGLSGLSDLSGARASSMQPVELQSSAVATGGSPRQDITEVSTAASLAHGAMALPDVRLDKVAEIQQALANGSYFVGADEIAGKLVQQMIAGRG